MGQQVSLARCVGKIGVGDKSGHPSPRPTATPHLHPHHTQPHLVGVGARSGEAVADTWRHTVKTRSEYVMVWV